jgi:uroporphyrinogen-III synthase
MKLLVTRPAADAAALADQLRAAGHEVLLDPIIEIRERADAALDLDGITGLLFTSANGIRAFVALSPRRDLAVYAVGDHTATAARAAGFVTIESADGDVEALARLVRERRKPEDGVLLHISGTVTAGELAGTLGEAGYTVRQAALYEAEPAASLAESTRAAIAAGTLDGVLLFSPRTARHFAALIDRAALGTEVGALTAWCLSKPVAEALAPLSLCAVEIAPKPTLEALLALIGPGEISISAAPDSPAIATPSRRRSTLPLLAALTVVIVLAAGAWWAYPRIKAALSTGDVQSAQALPSPTATPAAAPSPAVPISDPRLDRLEHAVGDLAPKAALDTLSERLSALEARPAGETGGSAPDLTVDLQRLSADLARLTQRVAMLETRIEQRTEAARNEQALVLAASEIRAALASSAPFDTPVAVIRAAATGDKLLEVPLATLESHAKTGIASRTVLAQQLAALPDHLSDPTPVAADAGFWDRVTGRLGSLVRIRRVDDRPGNAATPEGPDRRIADAQADLAVGDLAGAVKAIEALTDKAALAAKPWLTAAEARLDCEQAAAALETELLRRLSAGPAAAP